MELLQTKIFSLYSKVQKINMLGSRVGIFSSSKKDILVNGSFEVDDVSPTYIYMTPTGWNSGGDVVIIKNGGIADITAVNGINFLIIDAKASLPYISQTITCEPGVTYTITYYVRNRNNQGSNYSIFIDSTAFVDNSSTPNTWTLRTVNFTATATSHVIKFQNVTLATYVVVLDNIIVTKN